MIIDKPRKEGNYFEASASVMFMYVFAKGSNNGYLDKTYFGEAKKIFDGLQNNLIKKDANGYYDLYNTISGAGLGGNPYRDGSYEYYVNESKRVNDFKGYGPLILGSLEISKGEK